MNYAIWPECREIPDEKVMSWARDYCTDHFEEPPLNVEDARFILEDNGLVTWGYPRDVEDYDPPDEEPFDPKYADEAASRWYGDRMTGEPR